MVRGIRHLARATSIAVVASTVWLAPPGVASAATPSDRAADDVFMVDGPVVHDVETVGGSSWLGGRFSEVQNQNGARVASASGLAVLSSSGSLSGVHRDLPDLGGSPIVWDLSLGPNGVLYAAGNFTYSHGGRGHRNLIGINPNTGAVAAAYSAPGLKSVLATSAGVFAGGRTLQRFGLNGGDAHSSFHRMRAYIDPSLRRHKTVPAFREIVAISSSHLLVIGAFDWIDGQTAAHEKKVAVRVNASSGRPDLGSGSWTLRCRCAGGSGSAFGLAADVAGSVVYIAAGGSDWAAAARTSDGGVVWQTDTNGSAQDIAVYDSSAVIVGGHWTYIEDDGASDQGGAECPPRDASNPAPCWEQPRLAALDRGNGLPIETWTPAVCCRYRGVWATTVQGSTVHIGGEFTRLDGDAGPERSYGRFGA